MEQGREDLNLIHLAHPAQERDRPGGAGGTEHTTPGLLLLHGRGADEADLISLAGALDPRLAVVSARAPFRFGPGFAWYLMDREGGPDDDTLRASLEALREFIPGMCETYDIDPDRLFLLGFSQGAVVSAALAMTPQHVRGVIMHSGYVPAQSDFGAEPRLLKDKPFFVAHGKYDDVIPVEAGRAGEEYLRSHGARVVYNEYPIGHSISEESLYELSDWLAREIDL